MTESGRPSQPTRLAPHLAAKRVPFEAIPMVDFGPFLDGRDRQGVADEIGRACREVGFFYLRNHGVPAPLVETTFAEAKRFFELPDERKNAIHISGSFPNQRGYVPPFEENIDMGNTADLKEGFDLGRVLAADDPDVVAGKPFHALNVWPDGLLGFRQRVEAYHAAMLELSDHLVGAVALSLELPEDFFGDKMDRAIANLRLLHYPPQPGPVDDALFGCGAHSDYGFLTILAQDDVGGLQVRNPAGEWIAAEPVAGAFVVNIGELLSHWTNDLFAATVHRVINPSGRDRYSLPFFLDTNYDVVVECIESCVAPGEKPKYAPVIGGEYLAKRFDETFNYRRA